MFDFIMSKSKVRAHNITEVSLTGFELMGVAQVNPYCESRYEGNIYLSVVDVLYDSQKYDEKEGLITSEYFTLRKCPKCKKIELFPAKLRLNMFPDYLRHEEEVAFDAYSEYPSKINTPSVVNAFCKSCGACFEIRIKTSDLWVKEAKKIKMHELIAPWETFAIEIR